MEIETIPQQFIVDGKKFATESDAKAYVAIQQRLDRYVLAHPTGEDPKAQRAMNRLLAHVETFLTWEARQSAAQSPVTAVS